MGKWKYIKHILNNLKSEVKILSKLTSEAMKNRFSLLKNLKRFKQISGEESKLLEWCVHTSSVGTWSFSILTVQKAHMYY